MRGRDLVEDFVEFIASQTIYGRRAEFDSKTKRMETRADSRKGEGLNRNMLWNLEERQMKQLKSNPIDERDFDRIDQLQALNALLLRDARGEELEEGIFNANEVRFEGDLSFKCNDSLADPEGMEWGALRRSRGWLIPLLELGSCWGVVDEKEVEFNATNAQVQSDQELLSGRWLKSLDGFLGLKKSSKMGEFIRWDWENGKIMGNREEGGC
ncbi:unnamed protein product [Ilex paraguariensis]|uniref:Uncharacterized protein n=1 Tax=Ilex paraguariensis TaxID=185542 RepID=A0ABC8QPI4_9AQUA